MLELFKKGSYYTTVIPTEEYNKLNNPIDAAIKAGLIYLAEAANFGQSASLMWIKIFAKQDMSSTDPVAKELFYWDVTAATGWREVPAVVTPEQDIPPEIRGEDTIIKVLDALPKFPDFPNLKPILFFIGGVAVVTLAFQVFNTIQLSSRKS